MPSKGQQQQQQPQPEDRGDHGTHWVRQIAAFHRPSHQILHLRYHQLRQNSNLPWTRHHHQQDPNARTTRRPSTTYSGSYHSSLVGPTLSSTPSSQTDSTQTPTCSTISNQTQSVRTSVTTVVSSGWTFRSPVLNQYLSKRVDEMLELGMFEELAKFYGESDSETRSRLSLIKAIGVPEFEKYFRKFPPGGSDLVGTNPDEDAAMRRVVYEEAVRAIKDNTCQLAKRQLGKILRLKDAGWNLRRLDATEAFKAALGVAGSDSGRMSDIWEKQVVEPSVKIVKRFLEE
ncbi:hypothetical protein F0562_032738 [Nyssa sinensis]|uniref:Uncharacterized protein n=1 Tax=Nyssa sinensis TaxID=561372 RepID=A0A5J5ANK9_9ASTE|nr:hypothetical protein F0562_032738 [Nyssa sinensis]